MTSAPGKVDDAVEVSLGLPVFNGEKFLAQALESVLAQTHANFELIISDNASTDSTPRIIEAFVRRDRRIRHFRQAENVGIARNFNFIVRQARGSCFKFISANDEYAPTLVADCLQVLRARPDVVLCFGRMRFIAVDGERQDLYEETLAAEMEEPLVRYDAVRSKLGLSTPLQCGMIRLEALRHFGEMGNYRDSDVILTCGLALLGKFATVPRVHLFRRWGKEVASSLRSPLEIHRLFEPNIDRTPRFVNCRVHASHLRTMFLAPLTFGDKLSGLLRVLRHAFWDRRDLFNEFLHAMRGRAAG